MPHMPRLLHRPLERRQLARQRVDVAVQLLLVGGAGAGGGRGGGRRCTRLGNAAAAPDKMLPLLS